MQDAANRFRLGIVSGALRREIDHVLAQTAFADRFPARIATAAVTHGELAFRLRSGLELQLGAPTDIRLKLAIARRALRGLPTGATYLDVSVPGRPVAGTNPQLSGGD